MRDWVIVTMMKPSDAAVVLIHELQRVPVRPSGALSEFRKISELVSGLPEMRSQPRQSHKTSSRILRLDLWFRSCIQVVA
jgi:hypothetical protein